MFGFHFGNKEKEKLTIKEKLDMYDMLIANFIAGNSIIEPNVILDNSKLSIGYSNLASETTLTKYFVIVDMPLFLPMHFIADLRRTCIANGVRVNTYIYSTPHKIRWDSPEMRNKLSIWKQFTNDIDSKNTTVFDYDVARYDQLARDRIFLSVDYLNSSEKENKRTTMKVSFLIELKCKRDDASMMNMANSIKAFKSMCSIEDIKYREVKANLMDWITALGLFSLKPVKEVTSRLTKKMLTDDVLSWFNTYRQGRIGDSGILLGIDIASYLPVLRKFKEDPEGADNWLISAQTGGGKSYFVKSLLTWLLADGFVVTVLDYEGDEYTNLAYYLSYNAPDDVQIISMGRGSSEYFDPMPIGDLTGDEEIDADLKKTAIDYTVAMYRTMLYGLKGKFTQEEEKVMSLAIRRVYDSVGVTEDRSTWKRSKVLSIEDVYRELADMVESKELVDNVGNLMHKAAQRIVNAASVYFEQGEAKYGTFARPIPSDKLFKAKFIDFSFGMKGATASSSDPVVLALKQLSVANISIQIANHCKYVKHCFNVKVWEEFQRWGALESSGEIIVNEITGGRKRGTVNLVITNNLKDLLDDTNRVNNALIDNIQSFAIGCIKSSKTIAEFCKKYSLQELQPTLMKLSASGGHMMGTRNKWKYAFCLAMDNGKKAVVKVNLPTELAKSDIFRSASIEKQGG